MIDIKIDRDLVEGEIEINGDLNTVMAEMGICVQHFIETVEEYFGSKEANVLRILLMELINSRYKEMGERTS